MSADHIPAGQVVKVNGRHRDSFLANPDFVYVGRRFAGFDGSIFGNPFTVQQYGRENAILQFRLFLIDAIRGTAKNPNGLGQIDRVFFEMAASLHQLRGKYLGCWCLDWDGVSFPAPQSCHAVILNLAVRGLLVGPNEAEGPIHPGLRAWWRARTEVANAG